MLTFDANACCNALIQRLIEVSNDLIKEFYREATGPLSGQAKKDAEIISAHITDKTDNTDYQKIGQFVSASVRFYADAIMESFGTGSNSDMSTDAYWKEYEQSFLFNDARRKRGNAYISGRPEGSYTNIYGETQESTGKNAGKNIEYRRIKDKNGEIIQVKPLVPKFSIQRAEDWIVRDGSTKIERRVQMEIEKFLSEEAHKYFVEVGD